MGAPRVQSTLSLLAIAWVLGAASSPAEGAVIITPGSGGGNPDENLLLFTGPGVVTGPSPIIVGRTNHTGTLMDVFSGDNSVNLLGKGGQSLVTGDLDLSTPPPHDTLPFGSTGVQLYLADPDLVFSDLKFDVFAVDDGTLEIKVEGIEIGPGPAFTLTESFSLSKNGSNFFRVQDDGLAPLQGVAKVTLTTYTGSTAVDLIDELKHIRVGGIQSRQGQPVPQIPEPAAIAVWGLVGALGAVLVWGRTRRRFSSAS
ncbi:MAG: hypothetical protein NUV77_14675 [Thermoguttaceae bacterium]|jgi:hypothetical protein|nr:hypothetical protein [Thermoguttaceae bacterium]